MISKADIRLIQSLRNVKARSEERLYCVEGVKMVNELIDSGKHRLVKLFATDEWQIPLGLTSNAVERIHDFELEKISNLTTPNKVLALVALPEEKAIPDLSKELILFLDNISDPGNMGTIIRTAEWFGINRVISSEHSVDYWNTKVIQASMGSIFRMHLHSVESVSFLSNHLELPVYGTVFNGERLGETVLTPNGIIIIGSESHGTSKEVQSFVNKKITIFAEKTSQSESLNAAVAAAIVCYEFRRQFPLKSV